MSSIYDFSKTINDLRKEKKNKEALSFFKSNKLKFNENEIAGNEYLVSNILYCLRDINETDYGFLFLNEYNIEINKETKSRILTAYGWLLWSKYKEEYAKNDGRIDQDVKTFDDDRNAVKLKKTFDFEKAQFDYIVNSISYFKKRVVNPKFFLFSDNFDELEKIFSHLTDLTFVIDYLSNKVLEDFFLMSKCKHFAVAPTSFHWWAAWLNQNSNKLCLRPKDINPSNNSDFWPESWKAI